MMSGVSESGFTDDFDSLLDLAKKHGLFLWLDITLTTHGACPEGAQPIETTNRNILINKFWCSDLGNIAMLMYRSLTSFFYVVKVIKRQPPNRCLLARRGPHPNIEFGVP